MGDRRPSLSEPALLAAIDASRRWYDDLCALHRIPFAFDGALWWALDAPPRWHSAVKTLASTTDPGLRRMEPHPHGTVADSYGGLDLTGHGFDLLIDAQWLHHEGLDPSTRAGLGSGTFPAGWSRVRDSEVMAQWNRQHDTVGVLPGDLWAHPRFTVLARGEGTGVTGGAILHDAGAVVAMSNRGAVGHPLEPRELLVLAARIHPGRAVVDYAWDEDLESCIDAGFERVGPQRVWIGQPASGERN